MPVTVTVTVLETPTGDLYVEAKSKVAEGTGKEVCFAQTMHAKIMESINETSKNMGCDGIRAVEAVANPDGTMPEGFLTQVAALRKRSGQ
jgi:hypothetical protein